MKDKKFSWIREGMKQIVWDLVVVAVKMYPKEKLGEIEHEDKLVALIKEMYVRSIRKVFSLE